MSTYDYKHGWQAGYETGLEVGRTIREMRGLDVIKRRVRELEEEVRILRRQLASAEEKEG